MSVFPWWRNCNYKAESRPVTPGCDEAGQVRYGLLQWRAATLRGWRVARHQEMVSVVPAASGSPLLHSTILTPTM